MLPESETPTQVRLFEVDETGGTDFEGLAQENGVRFWYAGDYMRALGYKDWAAFQKKVLNRATRKVDDYKLNRFACCITDTCWGFSSALST